MVFELDVGVQIRQSLGVHGSIIEEHEDLEGEALRRAILLQLIIELCLAAGLENIARHPTTGVGVPMDRQAILVIAPKGTQVLGGVDQNRLQLAVSR